ncbi:hypothetical protein [Pseudomonas frederiksbergensis]|uniref:hypothetical protein n=1 Tax=Pseudomonas frederiksbergensis TaxID=104087 RepID=UPI0032E3A3B8
MNENDLSLRAMAVAAKGIMSAAESDRKAAEQAIARLAYLDKRVEQSLQQIPTVLGASAAQIAESVAAQAAERLVGKFQQADAAALNAARNYQAASDSLKRRFWLSILAIHLGVVLPLALLFFFAIPSTDEIAQRKQQIATLEHNIADLKRQGGSVEIEDCDGSPCVRTREAPGENPYQDKATGKKTYRLVWVK